MDNIISTKDSVVQNILYITIGCLTAAFTSRLYDVVNNYKDVDALCTNTKDRNYEQCLSDKYNGIDSYNSTKMSYMLVLGFVFIVVGVLASKQYTNNVKQMSNSSMRGLSLGGLFLIIWYIFKNWSLFSETHQVLLMGGVLAGLLYTGSLTLV